MAMGHAVGSDLEYVDEVTMDKALAIATKSKEQKAEGTKQ